jgi:hypothetical protein
MRKYVVTAAAALASVLVLGRVLAADAATPVSTFFEEAKISVNERAKADGYMRVRVTPQNGAPFEATIVTEKRMSENDIAKTLFEALKGAATPDYKIDRNAGEHVKIHKTKGSVADFSVEVTFSSPGFSITLDK